MAERPKQAEPLGSFEVWNRWVRDALIWLDQADPVVTMEVICDHDPKVDALITVLTHWSEAIGRNRVGVQKIIEHATRRELPAVTSTDASPELCYPEFREALLQVAGDAGTISGRRLSKWIAAHENRVVKQLRVVRIGMLQGFLTWEIRPVEMKQADAA